MAVDNFGRLGQHPPYSGGKGGSTTMADEMQEAFENANRLYERYETLAQLSELADLAACDNTKQGIVASVSPVMSEGYQNALLG